MLNVYMCIKILVYTIRLTFFPLYSYWILSKRKHLHCIDYMNNLFLAVPKHSSVGKTSAYQVELGIFCFIFTLDHLVRLALMASYTDMSVGTCCWSILSWSSWK